MKESIKMSKTDKPLTGTFNVGTFQSDRNRMNIQITCRNNHLRFTYEVQDLKIPKIRSKYSF